MMKKQNKPLNPKEFCIFDLISWVELARDKYDDETIRWTLEYISKLTNWPFRDEKDDTVNYDRFRKRNHDGNT